MMAKGYAKGSPIVKQLPIRRISRRYVMPLTANRQVFLTTIRLAKRQ